MKMDKSGKGLFLCHYFYIEPQTQPRVALVVVVVVVVPDK